MTNTYKAREALAKIEMLAIAPNPVTGEVPNGGLDAHFVMPLIETISEALQPKIVDLDIVCGMYDEFYQWARSKGYKHPIIASAFNSVIQWLNLKGHLSPIPDGYVMVKADDLPNSQDIKDAVKYYEEWLESPADRCSCDMIIDIPMHVVRKIETLINTAKPLIQAVKGANQ